MCFFNVGASSYSKGATIIFELEGAMSAPCGYDRTTGVFTVKIPGLYMFTINVLRATSDRTSAQIRIDQKNVCHTYNSNAGSSDTSTCTTIQYLKAGQEVDVYLRDGSLRGAWDNFPSNQFHGVLLR